MGIIFDIQRFCIHDGPGIRTTVFLKGCPLRCIWCSNPESQQTGPQFMFSKDRCMGCMECLRACPEHQPPSSASYLEGTCRLCGSCEAVCPRGAISQKGRIVSPAELVEELRRDAAVFSSTSGGVTFSGGEPLMQADFLRQCLVLCKQAGMDTCLETTCYAPWETIYLCIPYVDHFLCDVKNPLSDRHWRPQREDPCERSSIDHGKGRCHSPHPCDPRFQHGSGKRVCIHLLFLLLSSEANRTSSLPFIRRKEIRAVAARLPRRRHSGRAGAELRRSIAAHSAGAGFLGPHQRITSSVYFKFLVPKNFPQKSEIER